MLYHSLDKETSKLVDEIIRTWFKDWTVIAIAHKLDSIVDFDKVAVLDKGRLIEYDAPEKLLARDSAFRELYETSTGPVSRGEAQVPVSEWGVSEKIDV